jgi:hypothetical protein
VLFSFLSNFVYPLGRIIAFLECAGGVVTEELVRILCGLQSLEEMREGKQGGATAGIV